MITKLRVLSRDDALSEKSPKAFDNQANSKLWLLISSLVHRLLSDSLLRNSIFIMISTVVTSLIGYLYWVLAAHRYSAHDLGLASAFISAMSLTSTFANLGIGSALVQILPRREPGYVWSLTLNTCIAIGTLTSLVGGIIVAIAFRFLSPQFATVNSYAVYTLIFIAGVILSTVATLLDQTFVAERATDKMAVRNAAFAILKLPLMLLLVQVGALGVFSSWVVSLAATIVLAILVLVPRLRRGYCLAIRGITKQVRPLLSAFVAHHFINIGGSLPMYLLPVFVAIRLSVTDNAYFYTTWMLGSLFFMVSPAVATALFSEGSHSAENLMRKVRASSMIIGILLGPVLLVFFLRGHLILSLFGASYAQRGLPLLMLLMISSVPDAITNIYVSLLRVRTRLRQAALLNLGMAVLTLVLAWILLPRLGITGAGWAWLIAQSSGSLMVGADALMSRNHIPQPYEEPIRESLLRRLTLRNVIGCCRYLSIRLRFRNLHTGLFFLDRGSQIDIGPTAHIHFGHGIRFMRDFTGHFYGNVTVGNDVFFNRGCFVAVRDKLTIGNYCLFGEGVSIHDEKRVEGRGPEPIATRGFVVKPIAIGNNVWIGAKATILPGVCIGDNAVIGANAVVTHDVPANTIVGGIPARVLREVKPPAPLVEENDEATLAIWLIDTLKQLAMPSAIKGQVYRGSDSNNISPQYELKWHGGSDEYCLKLPRLQLPTRNLEGTSTTDSRASSPFFKRTQL